jgi:hypothetical protein
MEGKLMELKSYNDSPKMACAPAPQETIANMLIELRASARENRQMSYVIKDRMFNPIPCNACTEAERPETVESLLDDIRSIIRESNNTLCTINERL